MPHPHRPPVSGSGAPRHPLADPALGSSSPSLPWRGWRGIGLSPQSVLLSWWQWACPSPLSFTDALLGQHRPREPALRTPTDGCRDIASGVQARQAEEGHLGSAFRGE